MKLPFHTPELYQNIDYIQNLSASLIWNVNAFCNFTYIFLGKYNPLIILRQLNGHETVLSVSANDIKICFLQLCNAAKFRELLADILEITFTSGVM